MKLPTGATFPILHKLQQWYNETIIESGTYVAAGNNAGDSTVCLSDRRWAALRSLNEYEAGFAGVDLPVIAAGMVNCVMWYLDDEPFLTSRLASEFAVVTSDTVHLDRLTLGFPRR